MLGKLRQLSEQSQTELFDFISNNVVGIIKSEEVDDRMKEGGIEHKDNVIQVQFDGLIDLIHTCNPRCLVPNKCGKLTCHVTNYRNSEGNKKHVLIDLPFFLSKPCIGRLEKSGLDKPICNDINTVFLSKITWIIFIQKQYSALEVWR